MIDADAYFNLADYYLFDRIEEGRGERIALRFGDRSWTYADVAERTRRMVSVYADLGLRPEDLKKNIDQIYRSNHKCCEFCEKRSKCFELKTKQLLPKL